MGGSGDMTIYDIAREADVSVATASRALSDTPNVHSEKQRRVIEIARKYNFKPNVLARNFLHGESGAVFVVLPELSNPFYCDLFNGAEEEAAKADYSLVLKRIPADSNAFPRFFDQLVARRPDGLILAGGIAEHPSPQELVMLKQLQAYMPIAIIGQPVIGLNCVYIGSSLAVGTRLAVRHLHALGHKRIAFICGGPESASASERRSGFMDEMRTLDLACNPAYFTTRGYTAEAGEAAVRMLLSTQSRQAWPTAMITLNDLVALGALRQLNRMGIRVPQDIALVGCDNQFFAPYTNPPLTTLDLHARDMGRMAFTNLFNLPKGSSVSHASDISLVVRESCGAMLGRRDFE